MTSNTPTADQAMEYKIQEAGLNAPRLTPAHIDSVIREIKYHVVPGTTTTICSIILMNGYVVNGESAAASQANFNEAIGKEIAYNNARDKIWPLLGYQLRDRLYQESINA